VGKDHGCPGFDSHSVGVATNIRAQDESGQAIGSQSLPDVVKGGYLDLGSHVEPLGRDLHQDSLAEDEFAIKGKELPVQGGDRGCTNSLVVPEGKAVYPKQSIDKEENGEGRALITCGSYLLTNSVGGGVCIRQADVEWSKQGGLGAIKGVLGDVVKEGSEGWLWQCRRGHNWM
jgi:hypothetical protein